MSDQRSNHRRSEGLMQPSVVRLFGREFLGLKIGELGLGPATNNPLIAKMREATADGVLPEDRLRLAWVCGFSYRGNYFKVLDPPVMLVFGQGTLVAAGDGNPILTDQVGIELNDNVFAKDTRFWDCDQMDVALRIDITIGFIKDILIREDIWPGNNGIDSALTGRADLVSRADLVGRADLISRARQR